MSFWRSPLFNFLLFLYLSMVTYFFWLYLVLFSLPIYNLRDYILSHCLLFQWLNYPYNHYFLPIYKAVTLCHSRKQRFLLLRNFCTLDFCDYSTYPSCVSTYRKDEALRFSFRVWTSIYSPRRYGLAIVKFNNYLSPAKLLFIKIINNNRTFLIALLWVVFCFKICNLSVEL